MAMKESYYTVDGQMLGYKGASGRKDFLRDNLGSVTAEIDQTGSNRTFDGRYRPYGNLLWSTGTSGKFGWIGSWGYRDTGLSLSSHYVRARHFSTSIGAWINIDPIWPGEPAYSYVNCQVVQQVDPAGLAPKIDKGCPSSVSSNFKKLCSMLANSTKFKKFSDCVNGCSLDSKYKIDPTCLKNFCASGTVHCGDCLPPNNSQGGDQKLHCPDGCGCKSGVISANKVPPCESTLCSEGRDGAKNPITFCLNGPKVFKKLCQCSGTPPDDCAPDVDSGRSMFHELLHACAAGKKCNHHTTKKELKDFREIADCIQACAKTFGGN